MQIGNRIEVAIVVNSDGSRGFIARVGDRMSYADYHCGTVLELLERIATEYAPRHHNTHVTLVYKSFEEEEAQDE